MEKPPWRWQVVVNGASNSYLWVGEPGEVRVQVELDAFGGPRQRDPSDQEDQQHDIGERRSDIHHLPGEEGKGQEGVMMMGNAAAPPTQLLAGSKGLPSAAARALTHVFSPQGQILQ